MTIDLAKLAGAKPQFYMPEHCIVIKHFPYKEAAWEGAQKVLSTCSISMPHLPCSYKHFPSSFYLPYCFLHRVHAKPCLLERGLFCVHNSTLSIEQNFSCYTFRLKLPALAYFRLYRHYIFHEYETIQLSYLTRRLAMSWFILTGTLVWFWGLTHGKGSSFYFFSFQIH